MGSRKRLWPLMPGGWGHGSSVQPILNHSFQQSWRRQGQEGGGEGEKCRAKKKITDSNKFSCNGLKNKTLPKQVQLEVCVQKPYGQWECVGVLVRGAERPALPGCRSMASQGTRLGGASVGGACMAVHVCVHVSACVHVHVCACMRARVCPAPGSRVQDAVGVLGCCSFQRLVPGAPHAVPVPAVWVAAPGSCPRGVTVCGC